MFINPNDLISQLYPLDHPWQDWKGVTLIILNEKEVFFIKRSLTMPSHKGQLAGFGGMRKDDETKVIDVAWREFVEESGLDQSSLDLLGTLSPVMMRKNVSIVPVVASLRQSTEEFFSHITSNGEWSDLISVFWTELMQSDLWGKGQYVSKENKDIYYFPIRRNRYNHFRQDQSQTHLLWGATAGIIWQLINHIRSNKV